MAAWDNTPPTPITLVSSTHDNTPPVAASVTRFPETTARVVATTNQNIATTLVGGVIDGVEIEENDKVLLTAQTAPDENGLYDAKAAGDTRSVELNAETDFTLGLLVEIEEGTVGTGKRYNLITRPPVTMETTAIWFSEVVAVPIAV